MSNPPSPLPPQCLVDARALPGFTATWVAGALALAVAIGIGRFAFTPVLPLLASVPAGHSGAGGLLAALGAGATALLASAVWLWRDSTGFVSHPGTRNRSPLS